jgi:deoxyribonuclease IV
MKKHEPLLGSHVSVAGGFPKAIERGDSIECRAIQVFVKQNTRWDAPALAPSEAARFRADLRKSGIQACIAHNIYLVNLASDNPEFRQKSVADMVDEVGRCDALGIRALVAHPGSHGGSGAQAGIVRIAAALDIILGATAGSRCRILLETTAGQGASIGASFEELAAIIRQVKNKRRIGVCLDTCHVFAAGYDIRTRVGYQRMWADFEANIGLQKLGAIHLNDSRKPVGSRVDRHEHIGKGHLGLEPFRFLMNDPRLRDVPMILETEKDPDMAHDRENLATLRSLVRNHLHS